MTPYMISHMIPHNPHMISHMMPYMNPYRYIWAYREDLCRSIHDMGKQKWDTKKWSPHAWAPLLKWVRAAPEGHTRLETLIKFNDKDTEFWMVVATCLRSMSKTPNLPWGRATVQPAVYLAIPNYEKVLVKYTLGCIFFSMFDNSNHIWLHLALHHSPTPYMIQAWATACGIRRILGKAPHMWLRDFPHDVWVLHRKLHHRFLKYRKVCPHMIPHMIPIYDVTYDTTYDVLYVILVFQEGVRAIVKR